MNVALPEMIGGYRVVGRLGEGGMGAVYLGKHALLDREVAIKILLPQYSAEPEMVRRFFNEARALTQINDPGIVQVYDFGVHDDGSAFIVMERLDGESIEDRLVRIERYQPADCIRLVRMVCTSLEAAHGKRIVHRDLKPSNIYIVRDAVAPGGERPKLLDFGIAKLANDPGITIARTLLGTPLYMSPEQCRNTGDVDHRSDIYALGCLMTTMLTGAPPFITDSTGDAIAAHLTQEPPAASSRVCGIPSLLDDIVLRALAKSPEARFQSMGELARALAGAEELVRREQEPTRLVARMTLATERQQTTLTSATGQAASRRHRAPWIASALAAIAVPVVMVIALRPDDAPVRAAAESAPMPAPADAAVTVEIPEVAPAPIREPEVTVTIPPLPLRTSKPARPQPARGKSHAPKRQMRPTAAVDRSD